MRLKFLTLISVLFLQSSWALDQIDSFELPSYPNQEAYKYNKKKKLVINFWATWCTSCIQEIPILEKLKTENPNVEFIAINAGDSPKKISKFLKKNPFSYKVLMDKTKEFSKNLGILSLPQTLVIDEAGKVTYHKNIPPEKI